MPAFAPQASRCAKDGEISAFGAATGKGYLAGPGAQGRRCAFAGVVQQGAGAAPNVMNAGWVAPNLAQERQHSLPDLGVQGRRGVVVKVDSAH